jgi:hypothetical protein
VQSLHGYLVVWAEDISATTRFSGGKTQDRRTLERLAKHARLRAQAYEQKRVDDALKLKVATHVMFSFSSPENAIDNRPAN